jgi:NTE family protein
MKILNKPGIGIDRRIAVLGLGSLLTGCTFQADYNHDAPDAPRQLLTPEPRAKPVRNIWVLSSGGPRGFIHVGMIKALEEIGLQPDLIVGGSVGALVGVLYAGGVKALELERMALDLGVSNMGRLALTGEGKFAGTPLAHLINRELRERCGTCEMEKLPTRFAAAVAERETRQGLLLNHGDAGVAVQASCAIEGMFTPVRIRGKQYIDADLIAPLPVRMAKQMAGSIAGNAVTPKVLALDASAHEDKAPQGAERFRESDLRKRTMTLPDAQEAALTLHPVMSYWVNISREFRERTIMQGYTQTLAMADKIKASMA